jgi:WD40 repeat protein
MNEEPKDIKSIFAEAIEKKSSKERAAFLDKACAGDADLRSKVEDLLKAHSQAGDFLEEPAIGPSVTLGDPHLTEGPGTIISRYKILEKIGEGGMACVYMAEQKEPIRRKVALKIIKLGMDTKQVIARFAAERQALAIMDHPNIARVLDAGATETGRPYFVMELVKGVCITEYCDKNKLNTRERLDLFTQVCNAVQHAHQKGIIHRDIKPSNIMVTLHDGQPVPKVIDFGIAKATSLELTEKTLFTRYAQMIGTPEYMSPEQAEMSGLDIDTRTDIYSLGVLLYQLLTGALPFDPETLRASGYTEIRRTIVEEEPPRPSTRLSSLGKEAEKIAERRGTKISLLVARLRRELEWIPLKAMRKDRTRRYRSASELADDIKNYLKGNPLIAGPETSLYLVKKFVRKHTGSVATVVIVAAVIILGLVTSIVMGCRAEQARQREVLARKQVEQALMRAEKAERIAQQQRELAEERAEEYRRSLYVHRINLADVAHRDGDMGRLRKLLDSCPEDLRAWEWYRLNHISDQTAMTLQVDEEGVYDVTFAPDGRRIVSAGADGTIKLWDAADGKEMMTLRGHEATVLSAKFSPDGKRIASMSKDGKIKIWDAQSGTEQITLKGSAGLHSLLPPPWMWGPIAFSPDGKKIASGSPNNAIKVWDADSGTGLMTLSGHEKWLTGLTFTPDGKRIASSSKDKTLRVWDASTGQQLMVLKGHERGVGGVAISPDGKRIVSVSGDETAKVWDMATGDELMTLHGHEKAIGSVAFSNDGARIATGGAAGKIKVWDAAIGAEVTTLLGHLKPVMGVAFSPDGKRIVSGSYDGTVRIWEPGVDHTAPVTLEGRYKSIAFSSDGKHIVTGGMDKPIRIRAAVSRAELMGIEGGGYGALFSPDGTSIASVDLRNIYVWDASSGKKLATLSGHESGPLTEEQGSIWSIAYSPDGTRIVSGGLDKMVRVWNAITGAEIMALRGHGDWPDWPEYSGISSVAFSPDGNLIASGGSDYTVKIWNARTGAEVMTMSEHSHFVNDVVFSPDGKRFVSASTDKTIRVCDVASGDVLQVLEGHDGEVLSLAFSPDGKRIVSGSKDDTFRIWDAATGVEVQRLPINGSVWRLCFSPDGKTLATTSSTGFYRNCTITLWESAGLKGGD